MSGSRKVAATAVLAAAGIAACLGGAWRASASGTRIVVVGAENEYANVAAQIGGRYVDAMSIMSNPNTDPHTFEASPRVAQEVSSAQVVVQNGVGYDGFMNAIEQADPSSSRKVIVAQDILHLPTATANPHLWYEPATMPAVAAAIERDLAAIEPSHAHYFARRLHLFDRSLGRWAAAIASLRRRFGGAPVATTEPVADYMLQAAGIDNRTPFTFQADVMNGVDPSPQAVAFERSLLADGTVKSFVYNEQVTDTMTDSLLAVASAHHVPVVGVYETMPAGYDYQRWMVAEVDALENALAHHTSAPKL